MSFRVLPGSSAAGGFLLAALLLAGCASYHSDPVQPGVEAALAPKDLGAFVDRASALRRTWLKPVTIDPAGPYTPEQLAAIAVIANPDLKAERAKAGVADAQVFAAGLLPDPVINLGFDKLLTGPDGYNAFTGQISYDLLAFRARAADLAQSRAEKRQAHFDLAWQEWQTAGQAELLAARVAGLTEVDQLARESRARADLALTRALDLAAHGDVKADEVETRRIAAADAADKARTAEQTLAAARLELNKLLGVAPSTRVPVAFTPPADVPLDAEALFERARKERLDLLALEAGYDAQEAAVRKAVMEQFPSLQLTVTRSQDTANNQTVGPAVNFTLPAWNRNRGTIKVQRATRAQLKAEYAARVFATRADIAALVDSIETARRQRDEIAAQTAPLERLITATETAAGRGDVAQATAETARQSLADKQSSLASLNQTIAEDLAALETAVGGPLQGPLRSAALNEPR